MLPFLAPTTRQMPLLTTENTVCGLLSRRLSGGLFFFLRKDEICNGSSLRLLLLAILMAVHLKERHFSGIWLHLITNCE